MSPRTRLPDSLEPLLGRIERVVPAGMGRGHDRIGNRADRWLSNHRPATDLSKEQVKKAAEQFGTLGSGNHFFELCLDERRRVWVVLHSGSRGIGNQLAQMPIAKARRLTKTLELGLEDPDLAWFEQGTPEFEAYVADMLWSQDYAKANRHPDDGPGHGGGAALRRHWQGAAPYQLPPQLHLGAR